MQNSEEKRQQFISKFINQLTFSQALQIIVKEAERQADLALGLKTYTPIKATFFDKIRKIFEPKKPTKKITSKKV